VAETDLLVLGQDPRFGGGVLAQTEAFWNGAVSLGRRPELVHLAYRGLRDTPYPDTPVRGTAVRQHVPWLDGLSQSMAGRSTQARAASARSLWVVSTTASHGYAGARAGRPYACWIGTSIDDEWQGRRRSLARGRRVAHALSAPTLRRLERQVLQRATRVFATSPHSRGAIARASRRDDVGILPIPVDVERLRPLPDETWSSALSRPTLVFVGRGYDPRKNVSLLLDAFARRRRRTPEARLQLVGPPPALPLPEGAEALGQVAALDAVLRDASLLVVPSWQEGFGIVAAEALACGVPVLSTPCGGPEDLLRESGGGRVLSGFDAEEMATAAQELIEDAATLTAMRRRGRAYVEREHSPARFRELLGAALAELDGAGT
jgi:glycosyltransferase involved in cell wall biosynthesis